MNQEQIDELVSASIEQDKKEIARLRDEIERLLNPTAAMIEAGCEVLYGHPREKAIEWAKEDKFDGYANTADSVFRAMINAAMEKP